MLDTVFRVLKITVIISLCATFMLAINALLTVIASIIFSNVVGEIFGLISMYLPFNGSAVFGAMALSVSAIFTFLIAKKIFDLTSWSISTI